MKLQHQVKYDASPADVYAMLADPAFRNRVCEAMRTLSHDVSINPGDDGIGVRIDMVQPTKGVPGFAKRVVGDETRVIQTERWDAGRGADLEIEVPGKPAHIRGKLTLTNHASGTTETFEGEAKANIPLIGGKLEQLIGKLFVSGMDTEHRVGSAWLAGDR